jgi:hypothetical protein
VHQAAFFAASVGVSALLAAWMGLAPSFGQVLLCSAVRRWATPGRRLKKRKWLNNHVRKHQLLDIMAKLWVTIGYTPRRKGWWAGSRRGRARR